MKSEKLKEWLPLCWYLQLKDEFNQPYFHNLMDFIERERSSKVVFPPEEKVFNSLLMTPYREVKVVIVGQDPYHGMGQANGLSFSVSSGVALPPSLKNIYKELVDDLGIPFPQQGCLSSWASQGVLLLNATLTVVEKKPMSHAGKGWETFTDAILRELCNREDPVIFVLWGNHADKKFSRVLTHSKKVNPHYILRSAHPSPLSSYRGFFGCKHFSKINHLLKEMGKDPIRWEILQVRG